MDKPDKDPQKKPRRKPRKKPAKSKAQKKEDNLGKSESLPSLSSLASVLQSLENPSVTRQRDSIKIMGNNLQEHLGCFMLIGYTLDGHPVNMTYAPTPQDMDALNTGFHKFIMQSGGL